LIEIFDVIPANAGIQWEQASVPAYKISALLIHYFENGNKE